MSRLIDGQSKEVIEDLAELAMKLSQHKDTRKEFIGAVKKVDPNRKFPNHEIEVLREEMAEREEARRLEDQRKETERALAAQRSGLMSGRGFTEDQVKEVEAVMTKYGLSDYEAGADLWQARRPSEPPASPTGTWEFPTIGKAADFVADPVKASRDEAYRTITEFRRGRAA